MSGTILDTEEIVVNTTEQLGGSLRPFSVVLMLAQIGSILRHFKYTGTSSFF